MEEFFSSRYIYIYCCKEYLRKTVYVVLGKNSRCYMVIKEHVCL